MCVVCDGDTGLHSDALICATAQLAADLLNYTDNIISRGQCRCWARRGKKLSGTPAGPVPVPCFIRQIAVVRRSMLYVVMVQLELLCFMEQQRDTGDIIIIPAHIPVHCAGSLGWKLE